MSNNKGTAMGALVAAMLAGAVAAGMLGEVAANNGRAERDTAAGSARGRDLPQALADSACTPTPPPPTPPPE